MLSEAYGIPEPISQYHDVSRFACGKAPLNQYLKRYALKNQQENISRTYVTQKGGRVVGYYTLAFGSVSHEAASEKIRRELPRYPIPVILLARLAVDAAEKGRGLGAGLLRDAMLRTVQAADIAGLRAMLTHAKDEEAKAFYLKYGFEESPIDALHLMLRIDDIRESLI